MGQWRVFLSGIRGTGTTVMPVLMWSTEENMQGACMGMHTAGCILRMWWYALPVTAAGFVPRTGTVISHLAISGALKGWNRIWMTAWEPPWWLFTRRRRRKYGKKWKRNCHGFHAQKRTSSSPGWLVPHLRQKDGECSWRCIKFYRSPCFWCCLQRPCPVLPCWGGSGDDAVFS